MVSKKYKRNSLCQTITNFKTRLFDPDKYLFKLLLYRRLGDQESFIWPYTFH